MGLSLESAVAAFGVRTKEKLANPAAKGQPEDQLRSPFEGFLADRLVGLYRDGSLTTGGSSAFGRTSRLDREGACCGRESHGETIPIGKQSSLEEEMNRFAITVLTVLAGMLAVGEFGALL